jgi:putative phage-type endonuclease
MANTDTSKIADVLGTARWIGTFESNTPEWHALRATGIGGSDVGTITGCNPWQSPFTLWARRTGKIDDTFVTNEAMEWGSRLESVVLDKFADQHPELFISRDVGTWSHEDRDWQLANPDAIAVDSDGNYSIIEIKTARYEDDWVDGVPPYYRTQVQWYMQVFGFSRAYVAVLFSGSKYREFVVEASEWEQEINLDKVQQFREMLSDDVQPDYDGASDTYATIRKIHPNIEPKTELDLGDLGVYYTLAVIEADKADKHLNEMKSRVLDAMGSAKRGMVDNVVIVERTSRNGGAPYLVNKKG